MLIHDTLPTKLLPQKSVPYTIILPKVCHYTLFWLHGYQERSAHILAQSNFEQLAEIHGIAVILPDLPDTYYLNQPWNHCYTETFFLEEFVASVCAKYHLPHEAEHTAIGGISMGGFGSLLLGSHAADLCPQNSFKKSLFGKIVCISGAFIIDDILIGNPEVIGNFQGNLQHFQNLFGELWSLGDSLERNPELAAKYALQHGYLPKIFMACGTQDMLYKRNVKLRERLRDFGADICWSEHKGTHDWEYFHKAVEEAMQWLS